ncbi:YaaC family protein [Virgibacillus doumboii]|uniref:YaaC family protein n=1 Tax=Virgibacillus doumboii TaxID=2697503 RepID=UPI0013E066DF|nr:YaaC family protein [Virgibacillus doumboii]
MYKEYISAFYTYLQSQETAQKYLYDCYQKLDNVDAAVKSYENCTKFMYYLNHGKQFYDNGRRLDTLLQPILFFYGMIHLLKANLLTLRPNYPESTAILAHGVSSRKRKKKDYSFMQDEVKIQHNGLFPYFSEHLFSIKKTPNEKMKMNYLFALVPEMSALFKLQDQQKMTIIGNVGTKELHFPARILDNYHLTKKSFIQRIRSYLPPIEQTETTKASISVYLSNPFKKVTAPFFTDKANEKIYFPLYREYFSPVSEVMIHYLLLYNLSMLCRYESEWWGELLAEKPDADYPFIKHFLKTTGEKIPLLLGKELLHKSEI